MNKLKDVAGLLKAKITKDELEEALINSTSEQNWQTSTHILHEIANAAYNYEKWQQINEFIWDKLKKSKSWRKILKTLNLVQFLLKNGPSSIITSFKYDIYQFRSFDNYSSYDNGIDRGQSIREKAKIVVDLLSNEELLEEERVKAKNIRQKMSSVIGGNTYGGFGANDYKGGSKYGSIDNKTTGSTANNSSSYGDGVGVYGDYNYSKSTLDKYRDPKQTTTTNTSTQKKVQQDQKKVQQKKQQITKKPFQKGPIKLVKPGSKPATKVQQPVKQNTNTSTKNSNNNIFDDDILGGPVTTTVTTTNNKPVMPIVNNTSNSNAKNLGFEFNPPINQSINNTQQNNNGQNTNTQQNQAVNPNNIQNIQNSNPQNIGQQNFTQQNVNQHNVNQQSMNHQNFNQNINPQNINPQFNNQWGLQGAYNPYGQQQPIMSGGMNVMGGNNNMMGGYSQYNQMGGMMHQPNPNYVGYSQYQNVNVNPMYGQTGPMVGNQMNALGNNMNIGMNLNTNNMQNKPNQSQVNQISLSTSSNNSKKKEEDEFGSFSSGQTNNVKWLSSQEKGLIDFSDFGDQLKKQTNKANMINNSQNNGIDTTWTW